MSFSVNGTVAAGYSMVREVFERQFADGLQDCAQVTVYVGGELVVDLSGVHEAAEKPSCGTYGPSSLQNVFSSGKVLVSLVVAMCVDRGYLRYDTRIAEVWPEYAQHAKSATTVAELMRHEAGLSVFDFQIDVDDLTSERIKANSVSDRIAAQKPRHPPGEKREYHALTRGWIVNEVVRRVDPHHRTLGEFVQQEIANPMGYPDELCIGTRKELHPAIAPLTLKPLGWHFKHLLTGKVRARLPVRIGLILGIPAMMAGFSLG